MGRFLKRTKYPVYKVPIDKPAILDGLGDMSKYTKDNLLFDIKEDPKQVQPIKNKQIEEKYKKIMVEQLRYNDAPEEQYERLNLKNIREKNEQAKRTIKNLDCCTNNSKNVDDKNE